MLLARVIGNIVATQKNQRYEGTRAMLCRQITPEGNDMDYTCIALDSVNSGKGDIVVIAQETSGRWLKVNLPGSATLFTVPDGVLLPDTEYKLEVGTVAKDGNASFVETSFSTAKK